MSFATIAYPMAQFTVSRVLPADRIVVFFADTSPSRNTMRTPIRLAPIIAALALAACGSEPTMDEQLKADLQSASAGSIELAPAGAATKVVSGIEQVQKAQPRPTAPRPKAPPVPA